MSRNWRSHLALLAACLIWGLAFIAVKDMLGEVSYLTVNLARFILASLALLPMLLVFRPRRPRLRWRERAAVFAAGICAVYGYQLALNYGETLVPAGTASLIANTTPVFASVLAWLFLHERFGAWRAAGIATALGGVLVIAAWGSGEGLEAGHLRGIGFIAFAAFSWAVYTVLLTPLTRRHDSFFVTAYAVISGTVAMLPLVRGSFLRELRGMSAKGWGWLIFLGLACTVLGYLLYGKGVEGLGATVAAFYVYLVPPVSLFWAWIILGESLNWATLAGTVLILAGLLAVGLTDRR